MRVQIHDLNGHPYRCHHWGDADAPPILFLHGFPEYGGAWHEVAQQMQDRFHCIAPDLRGYGGSWAPPAQEAYRVGAMIPDMLALIAQIGAPVRLVAHDWGAALAYVLAASAPDQVARLAVMNGVHPAPFAAELAKGTAQAEASQYISYLRRADSTAQLSADGFARLFRFMALGSEGRDDWLTEPAKTLYRAAWQDRLDTMIHWYRASPLAVPAPGKTAPDPDPALFQLRLPMPHLILWGTEDRALLPATRDGVLPLCDDVRVIELPGCDHWLHHQQPEAVASHLSAFFS